LYERRKVYKEALMVDESGRFSTSNAAEIKNKQTQNRIQLQKSILKMKAFITALALASSYALAAPTEPLAKRASVSDVRLTTILRIKAPFPSEKTIANNSNRPQQATQASMEAPLVVPAVPQPQSPATPLSQQL
jgi:hypothetical protein